MFKRAKWMGIGLVAGFGASKWVERKARRRLERYVPGGRLTLDTAADVRELAVSVGRETLADFRHALAEGRYAMASRESDLRHQLRLPEPLEAPPARPPGRAATWQEGALPRSTGRARAR